MYRLQCLFTGVVLVSLTVTPASSRTGVMTLPVIPTRVLTSAMPTESPAPAPVDAPAETTWFGGTHWDPVDRRWEANRGGVWTFDSGVGSAINSNRFIKPVGYHALLEGWTSRESYSFTDASQWQRFMRRHRSEFAPGPSCVGSYAPPLSGDWSLWAGLTQAESDSACYLAGQGYGRNWNVGVMRTFNYTAGDVELSFDFRCESDTAIGYYSDYAYVRLFRSSTGLGTDLWRASGRSSGHVSLTLRPGTVLPPAPGPISIVFAFESDSRDDDEDGLLPTVCGGFAIDNINLAGGVVYSTDLESDAGGWTPITTNGFIPPGDYADIRAVSTLPFELAASGCTFGDSVLTFIAPGVPRERSHPCGQNNLVFSPWIDLAEAGIAEHSNVIFQAGGAFHMYVGHQLFLELGAQVYPDTCTSSGVVGTGRMSWLPNLFYFNSPVCGSTPGRWTHSLQSLVDGRAEGLRVGISLVNYAVFYLCDIPLHPNSTPWLDNIRVGVVHPVTAGVGPGPAVEAVAGVTAVTPNPWAGASPLRIRYRTLPVSKAAGRIDVVDLSGRILVSLAAASTHGVEREISWDGRGADGRLVAQGFYYLRLGEGASGSTQKLVVVR